MEKIIARDLRDKAKLFINGLREGKEYHFYKKGIIISARPDSVEMEELAEPAKNLLTSYPQVTVRDFKRRFSYYRSRIENGELINVRGILIGRVDRGGIMCKDEKTPEEIEVSTPLAKIIIEIKYENY